MAEKKSVWKEIMAGQNKLSEDDFTQPGEAIPRNAGFGDFIKYNLAHFDPMSEENMIGMASMSGGIAKKFIPKIASKLSSQMKDMFKASGPADEYLMNNRLDRSLRDKFGPRYESVWKDIADRNASKADSGYLSPIEHNILGEKATLDGSPVQVIGSGLGEGSPWVRVESSPAQSYNMELKDFLHRATPGWEKGNKK